MDAVAVEIGALLLGLVLAGGGGELFVRGAVGLAAWARIPAGIVGTTVAAFATSSPELSVGVNAALSGRPELALGDALGSNVTNVGLVLGAAVALSGLRMEREGVRRDLPVVLLAPLLTAVLAFDGQLSRRDGVVLLAVFAAWLTATAVRAIRARASDAEEAAGLAAEEVLGERRSPAALLAVAAGLLALVAAGRLIVFAATGIGELAGLQPFVIGATLVAFGTSTPELAATAIATLRGHDEVGLGTVAGSNIFNNLWIVGVVAVLQPIPVEWTTVSLGLVFGVALVGLVFPGRGGYLSRPRGLLLLGVYAVYVAVLVRLGGT